MAHTKKAPNEPVKVAHVATSDISIRYLLLNQLQSFQDAGYEVCGVAQRGEHADAVTRAGVTFVEAPMTRAFSPLADLKALLALYRVMRRERFTVVHTHTPKGGLLGQYAALLAGVPVRVHTIHGLYFPGGMKPERRWMYVALEKLTMLFSQRNFSQNPEDIPIAVEEGISSPDRIELIGNGIDIRRFDPALYPKERRAAIRASLGLKEDDLVIGTVARLVEEKGYLEFFRAVQILREKWPRARFFFAGEAQPTKRDNLSPSILSEMGIADIVQSLGPRDDVPDLYAIMDVFVLASHREGFPRVSMEASALGVPCVVTNIRGCRQTVDEGVTGHLVPARDPEALAEAISSLLADEQKRRRFGEAARRKAETEFDERLVFERIKRAYERLLG